MRGILKTKPGIEPGFTGLQPVALATRQQGQDADKSGRHTSHRLSKNRTLAFQSRVQATIPPPPDYKTGALPNELTRPMLSGTDGFRSHYLSVDSGVLFRLSYNSMLPISEPVGTGLACSGLTLGLTSQWGASVVRNEGIEPPTISV